MTVAITPSIVTEFMGAMNAAQQVLVLQIKSARHPEAIKLFANALSDAGAVNTISDLQNSTKKLLSELTEAKITNLLENQSNPEQNAFLWRLLTPEQMLKMIFKSE